METQYYYLPVVSGLVTMLMSKVMDCEEVLNQLPLEMEEGQALVSVEQVEETEEAPCKTTVRDITKIGGKWVEGDDMVLTFGYDISDHEAIEIFAAALSTAMDIGKGG